MSTFRIHGAEALQIHQKEHMVIKDNPYNLHKLLIESVERQTNY